MVSPYRRIPLYECGSCAYEINQIKIVSHLHSNVIEGITLNELLEMVNAVKSQQQLSSSLTCCIVPLRDFTKEKKIIVKQLADVLSNVHNQNILIQFIPKFMNNRRYHNRLFTVDEIKILIQKARKYISFYEKSCRKKENVSKIIYKGSWTSIEELGRNCQCTIGKITGWNEALSQKFGW